MLIIFKKFHENRTKTVDFEILVNFWMCLLFFDSDYTLCFLLQQKSQELLNFSVWIGIILYPTSCPIILDEAKMVHTYMKLCIDMHTSTIMYVQINVTDKDGRNNDCDDTWIIIIILRGHPNAVASDDLRSSSHYNHYFCQPPSYSIWV